MNDLREGATTTVTRTFTPEDVRQFADLSRDRGDHHVEPDADGRLLVHGLLTATLPTELGGEQNVLARRMTFEFPRPVYTGEAITCEATWTHVEDRGDRYEVAAEGECRREDGETVLRFDFDGIVRADG